MKHILLAISLFVLSACGGGGSDGESPNIDNLPDEQGLFTLQNIRFDARDYYQGEQVTVTESRHFEVQWVAPTAEAYRIDLYLSANGAAPSNNNKIVALKCGNETFSLCPNATGEVQCSVDGNSLACAIGTDSLGSMYFQEKDLSNLSFIIKGCDALNNCDVKTFNLSVQNDTGE